MAIIQVTVTSGEGTTTPSIRGVFQDLGCIAPHASPLYDIEVYDEDGYLVVTASRVNVEIAKVEMRYVLNGACTFKILNAAHDGVYSIKPHNHSG